MPGSVMPFYGSVQAGNMVDPASFVPPIREHRFPNAVWHQTPAPPDPNTPIAAAPGGWAPQGQFIQQLPTHQLEDLRYHHPQYAVTTYHQPAPGYQQPQQGAFVQTNGNYAPVVNGNLAPARNGPLNGVDYLDASPRPADYINGSYTHATDVSMAPPPSTTPNSRCSSVHLDSADTGCKTPTPSTPGSGAGNAMPGYPPPQPPQSQQQSSLNSSGYPGQEHNSVNSRMGETNESNSTNQQWDDAEDQQEFDGQSWNNDRQIKSEQQTAWNENDNQSHAEIMWRENERLVKQEDKDAENTGRQEPSSAYQQEKAHLNNRLKTMILNKQQNQQQSLGQQTQQGQTCNDQQHQIGYHQQHSQSQSTKSQESNQQHHMQQQIQQQHHQQQQQIQQQQQQQQQRQQQQQIQQHQQKQQQHQLQQQHLLQQQQQLQQQQIQQQHQQQMQQQQIQQQQMQQQLQAQTARQTQLPSPVHGHSPQQKHGQNYKHQTLQQLQNQQNTTHFQQTQTTQQSQQTHQQQLHQQQLHQIQQQQLLQQQHLQQIQQQQTQQVKQAKPQTPSPVHHQQLSPHQNQNMIQHHQQTQHHQQSQQHQHMLHQQHLQQLHQQQIQQQQQQHSQQQLQQSQQHQMSPQQQGPRSRQSTPDMSPRPSQRRNSSEGLMQSPNKDSQGSVRYRTPTPVSSAGDTKTASQSSQTQYSSEVMTSSAQTQFGGPDVKPNVQQMQFDKSNSMAGNFLAQGHHPRSLATEGGGVWDFGSPKKEPEVGFSAMENFMKFAASLNSASLHLNKGQTSQKQTTTKSTWHLPEDFQCKQEKTEQPVDNKSFQKSLSAWSQAVDHKPARDACGRYTWSGQHHNQLWTKVEDHNYAWEGHYHPAYRGAPGFPLLRKDAVEQKPELVKIKPNYLRVPFGTDPRLHEPLERVDEKSGEVRRKPARFVFDGDGGPQYEGEQPGSWCCRKGGTKPPTPTHGCCHGFQTLDEILEEKEDDDEKKDPSSDPSTPIKMEFSDKPEDISLKEHQDHVERLRNNVRTEVPDCNCFPPDRCPPEPGTYYTHLGAAPSLPDLRTDLEQRTGFKGKAIRLEKILYTGKEGKTTTGCPLAKWVIRRGSLEEKLLVVVKHRPGHRCATAWLVVVLVAWEGVASPDADHIYTMLSHKLTRFGLPTLRRCATNEPRTCACQGLNEDSCGASFSFGCSWSMYYNGCKFARSKIVRKFRLSVKSEEQEVEDRLQCLATFLSPLYKCVAPSSWHNQTQFEGEASDCRLGQLPGRPFSGVTACIDFCAHAHRDLHNMNNGCTVVVTLTKHRSLSKPEDEQLHVLPLYVMDESDEFGSQQAQADKVTTGAIEVLTKFPCEVRVRAKPLTPCRRLGKKRKDEEETEHLTKKQAAALRRAEKERKRAAAATTQPLSVQADSRATNHLDMAAMLDNMEAQLQSAQVSSTVLDSPGGSMYHAWSSSGQTWPSPHRSGNSWENVDMRGVEKIDPDSTTNHASAADSSYRTTPPHSRNSLISQPSSSPNSWYTRSPQTPWRPDQGEDFRSIKDDNRVSPALSSPSHFPGRASTPKHTSTPSPNSKPPNVTPPQLSPSNSEWPYQENSWDFNSPSVSPHASPFRVPRGRPPSRNYSSSTPQSPTSEPEQTFLKPFPPCGKDNQTNETQTTSHRQSDGKCELPQELVVKNEFPNTMSDQRSQWSIEKQMAWNDSFVRQSFSSIVPEGLAENNTWPTDYSRKKSLETTDGYQRPPTSFVKVPDIKQEMPISWQGSEETQKSSESMSTYSSSSSMSSATHANKPWSEAEFGSHSGDPVKREDMQSSSYVSIPNGYQGMSQFQVPRWDLYGPTPYIPPVPPEPSNPHHESLGEVTDFIENEECFRDSQMGGVAIALGHGSVLFECAKHELHATTALRKPSRMQPTRISLVFYQHRNLNRSSHGCKEWEERNRLRKLGMTVSDTGSHTLFTAHTLMRPPTLATTTWTTLFPMHPCMVTGPYQEGGTAG